MTLVGVADGTATVTVTARDPDGLTAAQGFQVTVETPNRAPDAVGSIPPQTMTVGQTATVNVSSFFSDPDGDALSYSASTSDAATVAADVSGSVLTLTAVAAGMATVTVTATDPDGLTATQSADVTVRVSDRDILRVFYEATGGPNWTRSDNWLTDAPLGEWYGMDSWLGPRCEDTETDSDRAETTALSARFRDLATRMVARTSVAAALQDHVGLESGAVTTEPARLRAHDSSRKEKR